MTLRYFSLIIFTFLWLPLYGQLNFRNYTIDDGLSSGSVQEIAQDKDGFIWVATEDGLNRFDGYHFHHFSQVDSDQGFSENITTLFLDSKNRFWIGTFDGILLFNHETNRLSGRTVGDRIGTRVERIYEDADSVIWATSFNKGIWKLDEESLMFQLDTTVFNKARVDGLAYTEFIQRNNGEYWIATVDSGMYRFNSQKQLIANYKDIGFRSSNNCVKINRIIEDNSNNLWIATYGEGVLKYNESNNSFEQFNVRNSGITTDLIFDLLCVDNKMFIITEEGLNIMNLSTYDISIYRFDPLDKASLANNKLWSVFKDDNNNIWFGHYQGGLSFTNYLSGKKFNSLLFNTSDEFQEASNNITSIIELDKDHILVGTDGGGLKRVNIKTHRFESIYSKPGENVLPNNVVLCLLKHSNGSIWVGTYLGGLCKLDLATGKGKNYLLDSNSHSYTQGKDVRALSEDSEGNIWITTNGFGVYVLNPKTEKIKNYKNNPEDSNSISLDWVRPVYIDRDEDIWIGTFNGLNRYNHKEDNFTLLINELSSPIILDILQSKTGEILVATSKGLNVINKETNKVVLQILSDINVCSLVEDIHGNIWLSTLKYGIIKLSGLTNPPTFYSKSDGLISNQFNISNGTIISNNVYFGSADGLTYFIPDSIELDKNYPKVKITKLKIHGKEVNVGDIISEKKVLTKTISETKVLNLSYKHRVFSLEFTGLQFSSPNENKYKYKLEPFDDDWIETTANNRTATYTNLPGGKYTFYINASNYDNVWNPEPIKLIIIVKPPVYKTWWFKLLVILLLLGMTYWVYHIRMSFMKHQNLLLTKKVDERTRELNIKNEQLENQTLILNDNNTLLEERQQQIEEQSEELATQRDSLEELNKVKDKFFSIIAHDIKNPFNTILGFSELLRIRAAEWEKEKIVSVATNIWESSERLYALLENLLMWSRTQRNMIEIKPEKLDVESLFVETIGLFEAIAIQKNISLSYQVGENALKVKADLNLLNTVLRNLVSNAIKFTNNNGEIELGAVKSENQILFKVKDNGIGMPRSKAASLFKSQIIETERGTNNEKGTGLGLIVCKDFIQMHKGEIWVESEEGGGSVFYFTIPE